jgi:PPOX class probable F420-dependent enzyme
MPNPRARLALTAAEQAELLRESRTLQVASINPNGTPHLVPMWFEMDDDGVLVFTTYGTSQKVHNLERDPRITVLAETGTAYNELRGISIDGRAEVVRDPEVTARAMALIGAKHAGRPRPERATMPAELPPQAYKRVTVRVHPVRVRTWDHRKLAP